MTDTLVRRWYDTFLGVIGSPDGSSDLRDAAVGERLDAWTAALTRSVAQSCVGMGWQAAAKGHRFSGLPVAREEYLSLDVVAFRAMAAGRWSFPVAVFELENDRTDDRVAYSLWKVLSVRSELRGVFCYRRDPEAGAALVSHLRDQVIGALSVEERMALGGATAVVVGTRDDVARFPYGFFRCWELDANTGTFARA